MDNHLDAGLGLPVLRWRTLVGESETRCRLPRDRSRLRVNRLSQAPSLYLSSVIYVFLYCIYKYEASKMGLWWVEKKLDKAGCSKSKHMFCLSLRSQCPPGCKD